MSSIVFKNVCKNYGNTQVVKNLNLEINPGKDLFCWDHQDVEKVLH